jgi:hypothetical protein
LWGNYNKKIPSRRRVSRGWGLGVVMALPLHPLSESFSLLGIINLDVLTASGYTPEAGHSIFCGCDLEACVE